MVPMFSIRSARRTIRPSLNQGGGGGEGDGGGGAGFTDDEYGFNTDPNAEPDDADLNALGESGDRESGGNPGTGIRGHV